MLLTSMWLISVIYHMHYNIITFILWHRLFWEPKTIFNKDCSLKQMLVIPGIPPDNFWICFNMCCSYSSWKLGRQKGLLSQISCVKLVPKQSTSRLSMAKLWSSMTNYDIHALAWSKVWLSMTKTRTSYVEITILRHSTQKPRFSMAKPRLSKKISGNLLRCMLPSS